MKSIDKKSLGCLIFLLLLFSGMGFAQPKTGYPPPSYYNNFTLSGPQRFSMPYIDNNAEQIKAQSIINSRCNGCKNNFYGLPISANIDIINSGTVDVQPNGDRVIRYSIQSPSAYGMQFYFSSYNLPVGAELYVYNVNNKKYMGGYTHLHNPTIPNGSVEFGTIIIDGNDLMIEYYEPASVTGTPQLVLKDIVHVFDKSGPYFEEDPDYPQECMIDVTCPPGHTVYKEATAVALILAKDQQSNYYGTCTGTLLNNQQEDGEPYFLTAKHCYVNDPNITEYEYDTWKFIFNHFIKRCSSLDNAFNHGDELSGAELLSEEDDQNPSTDYLLLKLNTQLSLIEDMEVCYAGWSLDGQLVSSENKYGIHHPSGDVKKVSRAKVVHESDYLNNYQSPGNYLRVEHWDKGATAPGSSGSPLIYQNRVIGQLKGGYSKCIGEENDGGSDWYGKFSKSYADGGFAQWLDPFTYQPLAVNTWCPVNPTDYSGDFDDDDDPYNNNVGTCKARLDEHGFSINGKNSPGLEEVCISNEIVIRRLFPTEQGQTYYQEECYGEEFHFTTKVSEKYLKPSSNCNPPNCFNISLSLNCKCTWWRYFIAIRELDINLVPISNEYSHWVDIPTEPLISVDGFDLHNYLPPGIVLQPGKYYSVKLAVSRTNAGYAEYTKVFHTYSSTNNINNVTLSTYAYGDLVNVNNSIVNNGVIIANSQININANSEIVFGNLQCKQPVNCTNFSDNGSYPAWRKKSDDTSINGQRIEEPLNLTKGRSAKQSFELYPNPAQSIVRLETRITAQINVYSFKGVLILSKQFTSGTHEMNVSDWTKGMYMVVNADTGESQKLVVQ